MRKEEEKGGRRTHSRRDPCYGEVRRKGGVEEEQRNGSLSSAQGDHIAGETWTEDKHS